MQGIFCDILMLEDVWILKLLLTLGFKNTYILLTLRIKEQLNFRELSSIHILIILDLLD